MKGSKNLNLKEVKEFQSQSYRRIVFDELSNFLTLSKNRKRIKNKTLKNLITNNQI